MIITNLFVFSLLYSTPTTATTEYLRLLRQPTPTAARALTPTAVHRCNRPTSRPPVHRRRNVNRPRRHSSCPRPTFTYAD